MTGYEKDGVSRPSFQIGSLLKDTWSRSRGSVSLIAVVICTALFLTIRLLDLLGIASREQSIEFLGLSYMGVFHKLWLHEFLTAPLLHENVLHLLFNMLALWMLGTQVEQMLGRGRYILLSVLCAVSSMFGFLVFNWDTGKIVLGYSGIIFGILVAQAVFFPETRIAIYAFFPVKMKYAVLLLGAVELYLTVSPEGAGIAHSAHLFGAVAAYVYLKVTVLRKAQLRPPKTRKRQPSLKPVRPGSRKGIPREL